MKDLFAINNVELIKNPDYRNLLVTRLNELINDDFNQLVQILYSIDISETKLKNLLAENKTIDAAEIISDLIIERQLQKIKFRQQFNQRDHNISEEEKW